MPESSELLDADLEAVRRRLSANEKRVLLALQEQAGVAVPDDVVGSHGFKVLAEVMSAASWLADKGLVEVEEDKTVLVSLDEEGRLHAEKGLPERRALRALEGPGRMAMGELVKSGAIVGHETSIALGWLKRKGWADISKADGDTILTLKKEATNAPPGPDEALLARLAGGEEPADALDAKALQELKGRKGLVKEREVTERKLRLTPLGEVVVEPGLEVGEEVVQLTPELIASGKWKEVEIRPYDVTAFAPTASGGKPHPLTTLIQEIRDVFVEMGFAEIAGDYVESAFWNMDVLFIPQDHPAREMQDTFYLAKPQKVDVDATLLDRIAAVHESGGDTGSRGWGGTFDKDTSRKGLLRTHTTVGTIRYLSERPDEAARVFSIGRVFRNETMDATHLPEFHQIEGIIKEPGANFRMLVGILKEFYHRMGFPKVRVRPAYFPYTEPSMEIEVFYNGKWMELGGSGIFRPEVCLPLGVKDPVCAWGLGLERLAMMRFGLTDIRDLYVSDVDWLRDSPIERR
ncbi:MAG: phenylalanine--tRNA ligase subunit alpha [Euryarchaeota archaeon]|nr:phenylalanine--tRNA ligase subunit alpha [Euryarchaeota archaeon]